jgi:hypothetical protein
VARVCDDRNACRILVEKYFGNRPLRRSRNKWSDNIKMKIRNIYFEEEGWAMANFNTFSNGASGSATMVVDLIG